MLIQRIESSLAAKLGIPINATWENTSNLGDELDPFIIKAISGRRARHVDYDRSDSPHWMIVGSILQKANYRSHVWGAGLISSNSRPKEEPSRIYAVRGPLTRDIIKSHHINCPDVFGDPAIILPFLYKPKNISKTHTFGLVPHYAHKDCRFIKDISMRDDVLPIDIQSSWKRIVKQILSVRVILSSSLHGLVLADSYGIPSVRIIGQQALMGGQFKFLDYRKGAKGPKFKSFVVDSLPNNLESLLLEANLADVSNAQKEILDACPILNPFMNKIRELRASK